MHELSIMGNILDIVLEYAGRYNAHKVTKINLTVGELSDLIPEWMQTYFDFVSKDTIADKAELVIDKVPAIIKCLSCSHEYAMNRDNWQFMCPKCDSAEIEILSGKEFTVKSIEID